MPPKKSGFKNPIQYHKPTLKVIGIMVFLAFITTGILRNSIGPVLLDNPPSTQLAVYVLSLIPAYLLMAEAHERIHRLAGRLSGYDPVIRRTYGIPSYVTFPDQFVSAKQNIVVLLSPFFVINTFAAIAIVADLHWMVSYVFGMILLLNTIGASHDLYAAYFDSKLPSDTEIYYTQSPENNSYIYKPESS